RQTSTTQDYPSLMDTFFLAHTVNGEFIWDEDQRIYEEMRRLEATGTYTDDEINHLAKGGKQRWHILGVGRVLPAPATASLTGVAGAEMRRRVPTIRTTRMRMAMAILSCVIYGSHRFAGDCRWGRNPLRAFLIDNSPMTSRRGNLSPAASHRGKQGFAAGEEA
nr:F-box domain, leucine-rich repeat domain, L domain-like protein [Tanacetum cinerariifolium]